MIPDHFQINDNAMRFANRRTFLQGGLGAIALTSLLNEVGSAQNTDPTTPFSTRQPPKAKRVIFLTMAGGPSHLETFDYKPELKRMDGKPMP